MRTQRGKPSHLPRERPPSPVAAAAASAGAVSMCAPPPHPRRLLWRAAIGAVSPSAAAAAWRGRGCRAWGRAGRLGKGRSRGLGAGAGAGGVVARAGRADGQRAAAAASTSAEPPRERERGVYANPCEMTTARFSRTSTAVAFSGLSSDITPACLACNSPASPIFPPSALWSPSTGSYSVPPRHVLAPLLIFVAACTSLVEARVSRRALPKRAS
ncbi:hypothetical protein C8R47DRAFT_227239 [Mycena vitilis]|nr:hypothetical protein C8R47DRAFT_227239 [Mycena vitilis]